VDETAENMDEENRKWRVRIIWSEKRLEELKKKQEKKERERERD
jgi:hypothetical protein